ncbi:citrate synthase [candidate division MSBL1 archaeon SCGC-AAA259O05]|uniref:Citrate synthase n=1 Tax=candidate division MSBL1 archaeon SCGC-AAA259O05 TaxID=1698271 RepID=A0A133V542_9EURY|nr:citrate synthase [candidate division MSBL1 archaeon SCGC-AAA259O05]
MVKEGMDGVVALQSDISKIDGEKGELEYRGYSIHDLAEKSSYEETVYLLWHGDLPTKDELENFSKDLAKRRRIPPEVIGLLSSLPEITHPMVTLRTAISYCGSLDEKLHVIEPEENLEKSKEIMAMIPTIIAYTHRMREGKKLVHPRQDLDRTANFLWMLKGEEPDPLEVKALDTDLILHAEHTLNASTYSSRIAASTESDMYAGIVSATGTLMGPLHGGASQWVIEMLREVKKEEKTSPEDWVKKQVEAGEIIPGFGHRVYKEMDPRAKELKKLAQGLDERKGNDWCSISEKIEKAVKEEKGLYPNVDFYAATVYVNLGIPDEFFIPLFAMARIAGWTTHMMEQYKKNKLIRPLQEYVGEKEREYLSIEKR